MPPILKVLRAFLNKVELFFYIYRSDEMNKGDYVTMITNRKNIVFIQIFAFMMLSVSSVFAADAPMICAVTSTL